MTDQRPEFDRLANAIERGDVGQALELVNRLSAKAQPVEDLIDEFNEALRAGDRAEARMIRRNIQRRFDDRQTDDELAVKRASATLESGDIDEGQRRNLDGMIQTAADTTRLRSGFLSLGELYLARVDGIEDLGALEGTSEALKERERALETERETVEPTIQDATLPARLAFVGGAKRPTVNVTDPAPIEIPVRNVGDESADSVAVTVGVPDEIEANPESMSIPNIDSGDAEVVELTLSDLEPGEHQLPVRADSPDTNQAVRDVVVTVEEAGDDDPLIRAFTGPDGTVRFEDVIRAITHYNEQTTIPGSETKRLSLEEVLWIIEEYNTEE